MYKAVRSSKTNAYTSSSSSSRRQTVNRYGMTDNRHSADKKARVNAYLLKRFRSGDRAISLTSGNHNIVLTLSGGKFSSLDALEVDCDGHFFKTVSDFRRNFGEIYDQMFDTLLTMEQNDVAIVQPEVVDVEYVPKTGTQTTSYAKKKEEVKPEPKAPNDAASFREIINSLNDGIPDEEISNSLYETSALLKQLDDLERAFPKQKGKLKKLYSNYLPYLIGILQQYTKMQHVQTDANYEKNVQGLKDTIGHINSAMKDRLIPAMSESDSINLSADMSTLEAMLRKDGMTSDDDIQEALKRRNEDSDTITLQG
ncbi:MAG: hypothetical protein IJ225_01880 [Solobacterium sp.]|nr:hypothetical protein [Solobacterium sp.]